MSKDAPSDRPQILIDATDYFGRKTTQKVSPEVNRQDPHTEFQIGWAELLRMPDSFCDVLLQIGTWVGLGAFTPTVLAALSFPSLLTYPVVLVGVGCLSVGIIAARRNLMNAFPLLYRVALIAIGVVITVWSPQFNLITFILQGI